MGIRGLLAAISAGLIFSAAVVCYGEEPPANRFSNAAAGFSIEKPPSWRFLSSETIKRNRDRVRLGDEETDKKIKEKAEAPLVVMVKHDDGYESLNTSAQVIMVPLGAVSGKGAKELLTMLLDKYEDVFYEFSILSGVMDSTVDGMTAAVAEAAYSVFTNDGRSYKTFMRIYLVPRGSSAFVISFMGPQTGTDTFNEDFFGIIESVKIKR